MATTVRTIVHEDASTTSPQRRPRYSDTRAAARRTVADMIADELGTIRILSAAR